MNHQKQKPVMDTSLVSDWSSVKMSEEIDFEDKSVDFKRQKVSEREIKENIRKEIEMK